jgi:quinoprotein glucose dehydrogenase
MFISLFRWCCIVFLLKSCTANQSFNNWPAYLGDKLSSQYSGLDQINTRNVQQLKLAWQYQSDSLASDFSGQIQCNPLIMDGVLYGVNRQAHIFAIDAVTGKQIWTFNPFKKKQTSQQGVNRGLAFWDNGEQSQLIFSAGNNLCAIYAKTGLPVISFADSGFVNMNEGLDRDLKGIEINATTPGIIYKDLIIQGMRTGEGPIAAPGHIRAYNVKTGKQEWIFHTIPFPGEFGYETWPTDAYKYIGGVNNWAGMSLDEKRGIVYIPLGSPSADFYGGNRTGVNLFGNSLLALDAETGKRLWHFQTVHHDLWDRDLPAPPNLLTLKQDDQKIDVVAQITKSGYVFIFNRETGEPFFEINEIPFARSPLSGEESWPTQPIPVKPPPFARQYFNEDSVSKISETTWQKTRNSLKTLWSAGPFIPPSLQGSIILPGFDGGGEWGGASVDPETGIMYVASSEMPWILRMIVTASAGSDKQSKGKSIYQNNCAICHGIDKKGDAAGTFPNLTTVLERRSLTEIETILETGKGFMPPFKHLSPAMKKSVIEYVLNKEGPVAGETIEQSENIKWSTDQYEIAEQMPYVFAGYNRFVDDDGNSVLKPPWGTLNAIDLNKGEILWQIPVGELEQLTKKGIAPTGTELYGGPINTAGGLIFIGATKDEKFRTIDKKSGKVLWETKLPAGGYATPATYSVNGKQFVVIACGGGKMGTRSSNIYQAFALPKNN